MTPTFGRVWVWVWVWVEAEGAGSETAITTTPTATATAAATTTTTTTAAAPAAGAAAAAAGVGGSSSAGETAAASSRDEADEWEDEEPAFDYEGLAEADEDFFAQQGDADEAPLNLPSAFDEDFCEECSDEERSTGGDERGRASEVGAPMLQGRAPWDPELLSASASGVEGGATTATAKAGISAPPAAANDPWASIDSVDTSATRLADAEAAQKHAASAAKSALEAAKKKKAAAARKS